MFISVSRRVDGSVNYLLLCQTQLLTCTGTCVYTVAAARLHVQCVCQGLYIAQAMIEEPLREWEKDELPPIASQS